MNYPVSILLIGIGATVATDLWALLRKKLFGLASPNYGMVGRWIAHMRKGRFYHKAIAASPAIPGEHIVGWAFHYLTGIAFAAILIGLWGQEWLVQPKLGPAMLVGIATVTAPYFLMQPGMGAGIAAAKTPRPGSARLQSLITHAVFGLGLYVSGLALALFIEH